jgi:hypothetical protein
MNENVQDQYNVYIWLLTEFAGAKVSVVASNAIVRELDSRSGQTKDYEI